MKRTLVSLVTIVCLMATILSLVSCGSVTLEDFKKNLGSDYDVEIYKSGSEMEEMLEEIRIDPEEVKVTGFLNAKHNEEEQYVGIIECDNKNDAKTVKTTLEERIEELGWRAGGTLVDMDGVFVFVGTRKAIEKAKG